MSLSNTPSPGHPGGEPGDLPPLMAAVARLARAATGEFRADDLLSALCREAAAALTVDGVGVMTLDGTRTRFVQASHADWRPFEVLQQILQAGPCRDAVTTGRAIVADSPDRILAMWSTDFADAATSNGIQAVLALPLLSRGRCWGTLDLYWRHRHTPSDREVAAAQFLADVAVSYLVMAADRDEARLAREQLAHQVLHDDLTGLPNRQLIHELVQHALNSAGRHQTCVAVLFIDIDRFKQVNDQHGHLAGDLVLKDVARRLVAAVRVGDSVGRLSGDEFVVLCEDLSPEHRLAAEATAELSRRLVAAIAEPVPVGPALLEIAVSIGVAVARGMPETDQRAVDLIHRADLAMYQAKNQSGRLPPVTP